MRLAAARILYERECAAGFKALNSVRASTIIQHASPSRTRRDCAAGECTATCAQRGADRRCRSRRAHGRAPVVPGCEVRDVHPLGRLTRELIAYLVRAAGSGANLLLNIGPRPDGTIQPEFSERLHELGNWLQTHGPSIYATRAGPITPRPWGATTQRGDTVFVHVLEWNDPAIALPSWGRRVVSAKMLDGSAVVDIQQTSAGITLTLPRSPIGAPDRVVVLVTARR